MQCFVACCSPHRPYSHVVEFFFFPFSPTQQWWGLATGDTFCAPAVHVTFCTCRLRGLLPLPYTSRNTPTLSPIVPSLPPCTPPPPIPFLLLFSLFSLSLIFLLLYDRWPGDAIDRAALERPAVPLLQGDGQRGVPSAAYELHQGDPADQLRAAPPGQLPPVLPTAGEAQGQLPGGRGPVCVHGWKEGGGGEGSGDVESIALSGRLATEDDAGFSVSGGKTRTMK